MSFLGLANYYREFVRGYAEIAAPLTALTKKNVEYVWSEECQDAFERLKHDLTKPDALALPTNNGHYVLDTDASAVAIGAILHQTDPLENEEDEPYTDDEYFEEGYYDNDDAVAQEEKQTVMKE